MTSIALLKCDAHPITHFASHTESLIFLYSEYRLLLVNHAIGESTETGAVSFNTTALKGEALNQGNQDVTGL